MRVLVIGSGAREHALCLALSEDPAVTHLVCAPGNAGTALICEHQPTDLTDSDSIAELAAQVKTDLVVFGPEVPLARGAADAVRKREIPCFGPSQAATRIESSKTFAKEVMTAAYVPTAKFRSCTTPEELHTALDELGPPYVVKDDGLASGKGVLVTEDRAAALAHGARCDRVVVEEYLDGPEVSVFCLTDGESVVPMLPAQDFKRAEDDDKGPMTGGVGAYCPLPWVPADLMDDVVQRIARPTLEELARRGSPFTGVLYAGLALTSAGPKVIEFNARFGDPEAQVVLPLLETPLGSLLHAVATGGLGAQPPLQWRNEFAMTVVMMAEGYPGTPRTGDVITGADQPGVIHAGTRLREDGAIVSNGGRVLSVTTTAPDLSSARAEAYDKLKRIQLPGGRYRSDIALRAVNGQISIPKARESIQ